MAKKSKARTSEPPDRLKWLAPEALDLVVGLYVSVRSRAEVVKAIAEDPTLKFTHEQAALAVDEAARRVSLAAQCDFDAEVGTAKTRLSDLYEKSLATADFKTALAAVKERNRLLSLYPKAAGTAGSQPAADTEAAEELAAVREALAPLVNADEHEAVSDIARRVVALLV